MVNLLDEGQCIHTGCVPGVLEGGLAKYLSLLSIFMGRHALEKYQTYCFA